MNLFRHPERSGGSRCESAQVTQRDSSTELRSFRMTNNQMKFSVNWLREFVELSTSIDALAELLTMSGVEIEGVQKRGADFDKVVVAQIMDSKPHPNADRLTVCVVDDSSGMKRQIVCCAKNYCVDDKVQLVLLS